MRSEPPPAGFAPCASFDILGGSFYARGNSVHGGLLCCGCGGAAFDCAPCFGRGCEPCVRAAASGGSGSNRWPIVGGDPLDDGRSGVAKGGRGRAGPPPRPPGGVLFEFTALSPLRRKLHLRLAQSSDADPYMSAYIPQMLTGF